LHYWHQYNVKHNKKWKWHKLLGNNGSCIINVRMNTWSATNWRHYKNLKFKQIKDAINIQNKMKIEKDTKVANYYDGCVFATFNQ